MTSALWTSMSRSSSLGEGQQAQRQVPAVFRGVLASRQVADIGPALYELEALHIDEKRGNGRKVRAHGRPPCD